MKKINKLLILFVIILAVLHIILNVLSPTVKYEHIAFLFKDLSIVLTLLVPFIIEKLFKTSFSDYFKLIWIIFIFMAHYLGVICQLYDSWPFFDKIVHTASGVLTAYVAMMILDNFKIKKKVFNIIFIISFSALCALFWETFEFVCNILVGGDAQKVLETGVDDTMLDMIVALIGSVFFIFWYSNKRT